MFTLVGDAELDEGSNYEAIAFAGAVGLDNLHAVIIDNASATHGWSGGVGTGSSARAGQPSPSTAATTMRSKPH